MWGHLVPLWPFAPEANDEGSDPALPPLDIPGSAGREDLLRPLSRACPNCRKRRWKAGAASPKAKKEGDQSTLCDVCRSIQAVSKFIPRKDFWDFADVNDTSGGEWLRLSVPKTASRLVHVHSSGGDRRRFNDTPTGEAQAVEVADGDVISLLWSGGATYSSSNLKPMAQFRVVRIREGDVAENDPREGSGDDPVDASPQKEAEGDGKEGDSSDEPNGIVVDRSDADGGDKETSVELAAPQETADNDDAPMRNAEPTCNAGDVDDDAKGEKMEELLTQPKAIVGKHDDASSSSSSDDEHLWNAGGFLKAKTQEVKVARGNYFRDVRAKYGDNRRVGEKTQRPSQEQSNCSSKASRQPLAKGKEDACAGSVGGGSKTEEEFESAPLTLPSQFLASYSKSFDSTEKNPSQPVKGSEQSKAPANRSTPQKSNQSRKRSHNEMDSSDEAKDTTTPKKSNVSEPTATGSVPISSLSYEQLVQLQKESAPKDTDDHLSVRHSVLSLTLALTSNASSWDADFLRECNADGDRKGMAKPGDGDAAQQNAGQRWMPRLLQGTEAKTMHGEPNNTTQA